MFTLPSDVTCLDIDIA